MAGIGSVKKSEYTAIADSSCFHAASVSSSLNTAGIAAGIRWLDGHLLLWAEAQFEVSQDAVNSRIKHVYPVVVLSGVSSCGNSGCNSIHRPRSCPWLCYVAVQKSFSHVRCPLEQFVEAS